MLLGCWWPGCYAVLLVVVDVPRIFTTNTTHKSNKIMLTASNGLELLQSAEFKREPQPKTHISLPNVNKIKNNNKMTWPICNKSVLYNITSYTLSNGMCCVAVSFFKIIKIILRRMGERVKITCIGLIIKVGGKKEVRLKAKSAKCNKGVLWPFMDTIFGRLLDYEHVSSGGIKRTIRF